jgi:Tol biopolymer transport system component
LFSFGVVLYEMATGALPFPGGTAASIFDAILHKEPAPPSRLNPQIPAELDRIIIKALEKDRKLRYQTASDLLTDLNRLKRDTQSSGAAAIAKPTAGRVSKVGMALAVVTICIVATVAYFSRWRGVQVASLPQNIAFTQLTEQSGQETYPSISPDGRSVAYAAQASGNWDIYVQRVGGKNPVNLTQDSPSTDLLPAFSPDGEHIAFRSERSGGGLFIMGATGESVRRLTDFGHHPAWSPDGKQIAFTTALWGGPTGRYAFDSQLWVVNVSTGVTRQLTKPDAVPDAAQPSWSPNGRRIAFWAVRGGIRDIWTVSADGTHPVAVTNDIAVDWNPVWSPVGNHLYFASDRGGSMNLWRVQIDGESGRPGKVEPVTTPSPYSAPFSISRDGRRIAYVQQITRANIRKVEFDPGKEAIASPPQWVTEGSRGMRMPQLSPDGEWLAFVVGAGRQEDIFVMKNDGTASRQLTNGDRNRFPRWSPDGKRIAFQSSRGGKFDIWVINPDGSGLERLTYASAPAVYFPVWSPNGKRLVYTLPDSNPFIMEVAKAWTDQSPTPVIAPRELTARFEVWSWSADGRYLAGELRKSDATPYGLAIYSLESGKLERLTDLGLRPAWLSDSRRLVYQNGERIYLIDTRVGKPRELLSIAPYRADIITVSRDDRLIYFDATVSEADIWLATLE